MSHPRHLLSIWHELKPILCQCPRRGLFLDFDGTLARVERHPNRVHLSPKLRRLLAEISSGATTVGIVSGRTLPDIQHRVRLPRLWYAGAQGGSILMPCGREVSLLRATERRAMRRLKRILVARLHGLRGIRMEFKEATIAVHYRAARAPNRLAASRIVSELAARHPELEILRGKKVWEVLPGRGWNKAIAIRWILRHEPRLSLPRGRVIFYLGDDATDERVFAQYRRYSVVVGRTSRTAARYFLRSPDEVRRFLEYWKEAAG